MIKRLYLQAILLLSRNRNSTVVFLNSVQSAGSSVLWIDYVVDLSVKLENSSLQHCCYENMADTFFGEINEVSKGMWTCFSWLCL